MRGKRSSKSRMRDAAGQAVGRWMVIRVFSSTTRAAILIRRRRSVSNWAGRQGDRGGSAARKLHINQ